MASCVPVSQRPLSQEMKGSSDTAWMRPGNEQELEGGLTESSAPCQSLLASSWAVPGAQPCALTEPRGSLQWHLAQKHHEVLDTSAVLAHWHQALGLGEHAGTPGWGIPASTCQKLGNPLDQGIQCRHGKCVLLVGCSQNPTFQQS